MFGLEEIICCKQDYDYEDEVHRRFNISSSNVISVSPSISDRFLQELYSPALFTHNPNFLPTSPYRDAFDDYKSNQESMIEKEHTKYAATHHSDFSIGPMNLHSLLAVAAPVHSMRVTVSMSSMRPPIIYDICHGPDFSDTPLLGKLSVVSRELESESAATMIDDAALVERLGYRRSWMWVILCICFPGQVTQSRLP